VALVINHRVPQGNDGGVCKGKVVNVRWFIDRPAANYSGKDLISVTWTNPQNTGKRSRQYVA
jgi:hypothetical protein